MIKYFKPANLLFYLLTIIVFSILGSIVTSASGVADNQGLAAAAIVLGYGFITGFAMLCVAIIVVAYSSQKLILTLNRILAALCVIVVGIIIIRIVILNNREQKLPTKKPATKTSSLLAQSIVPTTFSGNSENLPMGLGMVKPDFSNHSILYFYNNPNLQKAVNEHVPFDSLVFRQTELGYEISYAPPWFVPVIYKMDYDILYLRAQTLHRDFLEVMVNETSGQTAWVNRFNCKLYHWPEFLFMVNTIEPIDPDNNLVRIKPLNHASPVKSEYTFLRPIQVTSEWVKVELLDNNLRHQCSGWIRWKKANMLLITWSLFS